MNNIEQLAKLIRYYSLVSTTEAGSGHTTSSLSAADLMTVLFFGRSRNHPPPLKLRRTGAEGTAVAESSAFASASADRRGDEAFFRADLDNHEAPNNDRLIFSKGHASPLFYSLYAVAGQRKNNV